jgi:hypothetical protein
MDPAGFQQKENLHNASGREFFFIFLLLEINKHHSRLSIKILRIFPKYANFPIAWNSRAGPSEKGTWLSL